MSSESEMQTPSNDNIVVAKKMVLPDKYIKQMVFGYWIHSQCMEKGMPLLETLRLHDTVEVQKEFYDIFDTNFKDIKNAMTNEIKSTMKTKEVPLKPKKKESVIKPVEGGDLQPIESKKEKVKKGETGDLMEDIKKDEKSNKPEKVTKGGKSDKSEKTKKVENEKVEKVEKVEKAEKAKKDEKSDKPEKVKKVDKEKVEKPEKVKKEEKVGKEKKDDKIGQSKVQKKTPKTKKPFGFRYWHKFLII